MPDADEQEFLAEVARRHGLSEGATRALWDALRAGNGFQAQFSHPELGGMGQWSSGMLQIGDMFNAALKARVLAAFVDLAARAAEAPASGSGAGSFQRQRQGDGPWMESATAREGAWWPEHLGQPSSTGSQNDMRYALFPDRRRLVLRRDGKVAVYDTGEHGISGFSQQQSTHASLAFTSQFGAVRLDELRLLHEDA